ncbi:MULTISPECIES: hypothetical protein [Gammaproteobacteria]|uniref:hypothetical protein n=1 Tax=Gammaproteobacteria TaxID=1236 RepID=UPI000DD0E8BC|nr:MULTISPECIES: hypothetical protein [Gammaproteobacteria]RTE86908.1 hypothetical protein DQX04_00520 [Aliidiomarina sp. B3213]TCZ93302.1 hypothetical protein EYQ95_04780 [Lysobacter sp. N42]
MDVAEILKWAVIGGVAVMVFLTIVGPETKLSKWIRDESKSDDLNARVEALEARVAELEKRN